MDDARRSLTCFRELFEWNRLTLSSYVASQASRISPKVVFPISYWLLIRAGAVVLTQYRIRCVLPIVWMKWFTARRRASRPTSLN